jgi:hypothetical protein
MALASEPFKDLKRTQYDSCIPTTVLNQKQGFLNRLQMNSPSRAVGYEDLGNAGVNF